MLTLAEVETSASGRPVMLPGETELMLTNKVDFTVRMRTSRKVARQYKDGRAVVTSARLLWLAPDGQSGVSASVPLPVIRNVERKSHWTAMRLKLAVDADNNGMPLTGTGPSFLQYDVLLLCHGSGKHLDAFHAALLSARREVMATVAIDLGSTALSPSGSGEGSLGPLAAAQSLPAKAGSGAPANQRQAQEAADELIAQMVAMGFNENRAAHAALATTDVSAALEWLLEHEDDPLLDLPPLAPRPGGSMAPQPVSPGPRSGVGVAAIINREQQKVAATDRSLDQAFKDLNALMAQAGEMVELAQRFRSQLPQLQPGGLEGEGTGDPLDAETLQLENDLLAMGIANPVTKEASGAAYHRELARQLSDFLDPLLLRNSGILPLADVYYAYNRARGTELISPDDLQAAALRFPKVNAPMQLHWLPSGVCVVQHASYSITAVASRILDLLQQLTHSQLPQMPSVQDGQMVTGDQQADGPEGMDDSGTPALGPSLTATELVKHFQVPIAIAGEWLSATESAGILCRDDGLEGLRYFRNFFMEVSV